MYIVVTLTIAMDTVLADSNDHDPAFGSDGTSFLGFHAIDKDNYAGSIPCFNLEGDATNTNLINRAQDSTIPKAVR